jgi:hypothetical protein
MCVYTNCDKRLIFDDRKEKIEKILSLTTNFLSCICQPFNKRIQRSVPSGLSYSQKPNAKKRMFL